MKYRLFLVAVLGIQVMQAEMRDSATAEEREASYRQSVKTKTVKSPVAAPVADPYITSSPRNIIEDSDVICFNGLATLVPKRAVLQIPQNYKNRLKYIPGTKLVAWSEFYALNYSWITTIEVSPLQAEGKDPIADNDKKKIEKSGNLMIAVHRTGPISVLPAKKPLETQENK